MASGETPLGGQRDREILQRRASVLAQPLAGERQQIEQIQIVPFELSGQRFALEAAEVRETLPARELTFLPGLPPAIAGLINVRSRVVAAVDLRPLLQLPPSPAPDAQSLVVAEFEGGEFALLVDAILASRELPLATLRRDMAGLNAHLLRGLLLDDGLALLDLPSVFASLVVNDGPPAPSTLQ